MEVTTGFLMVVGGATGFLICLILLLFLPGIFRRKREKLLKKMGQE